MIKLKDLLLEGKPLTEKDIKIGDAYKTRSSMYEVEFVYRKDGRDRWITIEFRFKPSYGNPEFSSVGSSPTKGIDRWGKSKKINVTSSMKKIMIKTLEDAIKSKYKGSPETDILLRNRSEAGSLSDVLNFVKRL
tara:strand:+ start:582 stop:983 length:402 start_codon:yes stop_codon:yes gene_type:complete